MGYLTTVIHEAANNRTTPTTHLTKLVNNYPSAIRNMILKVKNHKAMGESANMSRVQQWTQ